MNRTFREAFRSGHTRFALFLVVLTASVLAFFCCKTFVDPGQRQYAPDFGKFPWIEPPHPSPAGYFRGTIYISQAVERGWIEIAATDHFLVYVNGKLVNETYFGDERVTGIFDIRNDLVQGKNVIAVYVPRTFAPGSSQVRLRGAYATPGARDQEFGTSALWKASNTPDHVINSFQWYDVGLDDANWAAARVARETETYSTVQALTVPPRLFENETRAQWIGAHEAAAQIASFAGTFALPAQRGESWLQIASNGAYDVFINGYYAITQPRRSDHGPPVRGTLCGRPGDGAIHPTHGIACHPASGNPIPSCPCSFPCSRSCPPCLPTTCRDGCAWAKITSRSGCAQTMSLRCCWEICPRFCAAAVAGTSPPGGPGR